MGRRHVGQHGESCFGCKVQSINVSPSAMPSRRNTVPPAPPNNSWERGIIRDDRGQPILRGGAPIGVHEYQSNRSHIDQQVRALKQGHDPSLNERH